MTIDTKPEPGTPAWTEYWKRQVAEAQDRRHLVIEGQQFARLPYGDRSYPCHDCAVIAGQLHVAGCDMERCPACGGQAITCGCDVNEDDTESGETAH